MLGSRINLDQFKSEETTEMVIATVWLAGLALFLEFAHRAPTIEWMD
jgi:hypothetical protein